MSEQAEPGVIQLEPSPSDRRAKAIHDHFEEVATDDEGTVASTQKRSLAKNRPSELKSSVEAVVGESLAWVEVYRAMERLPSLSGRYTYVKRPKSTGRGHHHELHRGPSDE